MSKTLHRLTTPQCVSLWLLCLLVLVNVGCQRRQNADIAGVNIPIPDKMTKLPDKGFVPVRGFEDGQVVYQGKVTRDEVFNFYQEVLAAKSWQPNTYFAAEKDRIAYMKGNRVLLVTYSPNPDGTTVLVLMVGSQYPPK